MKTIKKLLTVLLIALLFTGCSGEKKNDEKVIKVGATAVPHAMILKDVVKDVLAEKGWTLEVIEFTDYVTPNTSLESGEIDANYFQTLAYLEDQNSARGLHLAAVAGVHYEPMTIFSKNYQALEDLPDGATISIPSDYDNEKRALNVAAAAGLIEYDGSLVSEDGEPLDGITSNPRNIEFVPVDAALVPTTNDDVDALIVNGNYALESKIKDKANAVFVEVPDIAARTNYVAVKAGNEDTEKTKALVEAITSQAVKEYIEKEYGSAVICVF